MRKKQTAKLKAQTFTTADVVSLTGVEPETLQNWVKRGYTNSSVKKGAGKGTVRLWKWVDVEAIAIAINLVNASVAPSDALSAGTLISVKTFFYLYNTLGKETPDWEDLSLEMPAETTTAVAIMRLERTDDDEGVLSVFSAERPPGDLFSDPRLAIIVPIGVIKSRLRERWAEIESSRTRKRRTT
jgi:hypothetical protein